MNAHLHVAEGANYGNSLRTPPCSYEAERSLLGAILMNNRSHERVADFLLPLHFADPANGKIFAGITSLLDSGKQAHPATLTNVLPADLVPGGLSRYLAGLVAGVVTIINAGDYGRLIYDLFLRRELIALGEDMVNEAFDSEPEVSALVQIETAESKLFTLVSGVGTEGGLNQVQSAAQSAVAAADAAFQRDGRLVGVTTGLLDLNRRLGGLCAPNLSILAGRPSMGKTALAMTIAFNAAKHFAATTKQRVAFFSLEMSEEQLATRILAHLTNLNVQSIINGDINSGDLGRLMIAQQSLDGLPLDIDDSAALSVAAIRSRCRKAARKYRQPNGESGLGLVVIDYLQLIAPARGNGQGNREQEISAISRGLKAMAKDLDVPVLALAQLSRKVEEREDKRPMLSDLRESGALEQDADVVMFCFREQYYLERAQPTDPSKLSAWTEKMDRARNVAEVIVAKQRQGPVGTERCHFDGATTWFSDLAKTHN